MYDIEFYADRNGKSEIEEYLINLQQKNNKDSRIKFNKITSYIDALKLNGTIIGEPYIKHLEDDIWELRPIRDRILFAYWKDNKFILLHIFMKDTKKTPPKEIEKAKANLKDFIERND
ncbi:MAG: type II toxin-antitoxin system RelE/ParE family toxin [Firmicutes bacterium]|nr:type II toxin-antitoxin system RelE/ParE family toxin [Bacillota bacterium]